MNFVDVFPFKTKKLFQSPEPPIYFRENLPHLLIPIEPFVNENLASGGVFAFMPSSKLESPSAHHQQFGIHTQLLPPISTFLLLSADDRMSLKRRHKLQHSWPPPISYFLFLPAYFLFHSSTFLLLPFLFSTSFYLLTSLFLPSTLLFPTSPLLRKYRTMIKYNQNKVPSKT